MDVFALNEVTNWPLFLLMFAALGSVTGFAAGLLGVGGGIVIVPGLFFIFKYLGLAPQEFMHVFVGTSLAVIVPTGFASARAHWKRGAVDLALVKNIGIGIVFGVAIGTGLADFLSGAAMNIIFASVIMCLAVLMAAEPKRFEIYHKIPPQPWSAGAGFFIGAVSTLVGIGGATLSVPFMSLCRVPIHKAIGSAAALGLVIALPASIGFIIIGWGEAGLPPYSFGYVNILIWTLIAPMSVFFAPIGAAVSHKIPVNALRKLFAVFIVVVAIKMGFEVLVH